MSIEIHLRYVYSNNAIPVSNTIYYCNESHEFNSNLFGELHAIYNQKSKISECVNRDNSKSNSSLPDKGQMKSLASSKNDVNIERKIFNNMSKKKIKNPLFDQGIQCELITSGMQTIQIGVQTNIPISTIHKCVQIDLFISNLNPFKEDQKHPKEEQLLHTLSPTKSLNISAEITCKAAPRISTTLGTPIFKFINCVEIVYHTNHLS